jgi:glutaredoxin
MKTSKMKIITKNDCHWCYKLKEFLDSKKVNYEELRVGEDITVEEAVELLDGGRAVPRVIVDNTILGGYTDIIEHWESIWENYGPFDGEPDTSGDY